MTNGKGSAPRSGANPVAYASGWETIFGAGSKKKVEGSVTKKYNILDWEVKEIRKTTVAGIEFSLQETKSSMYKYDDYIAEKTPLRGREFKMEISVGKKGSLEMVSLHNPKEDYMLNLEPEDSLEAAVEKIKALLKDVDTVDPLSQDLDYSEIRTWTNTKAGFVTSFGVSNDYVSLERYMLEEEDRISSYEAEKLVYRFTYVVNKHTPQGRGEN